MQGEPRAGCRIVPLTVNRELLRAFDALVERGQRSRELEKLMREKVLRERFAHQVAEEGIREMLRLID